MRRLGVLVALSAIVIDQITKAGAVAALSDGSISLIGETVAFRLTRNPGAAFSSFQNGGPILGLIAIGMAIIIYRALAATERRWEAVALGLVMGGAIGNLMDRVFRGDGFLDGAVIDFLDFSFWPTFNIADSVITVGVVGLLLVSFSASRADEAE